MQEIGIFVHYKFKAYPHLHFQVGKSDLKYAVINNPCISNHYLSFQLDHSLQLVRSAGPPLIHYHLGHHWVGNFGIHEETTPHPW